jgi:ParB-like chromosome segregation protein Spo0J
MSEYKLPKPEKYQLLPPLPPEQFEALKADIAERGVVVPVLVDEFGAIIDGHNRAKACRELGINDYPVQVQSGLSEEEKRALSRQLNALRRHLNRDQVRALIADQLRETPAWSNNRIAGGLGVDDKTVASVRAGLEATSELPKLKKLVGADGKERPVQQSGRKRSSVSRDVDSDDDDDDDDEDECKSKKNREKQERRNEREWEEAFGLQPGELALKKAKFEHAIGLIEAGVDPQSEKVIRLQREAAVYTMETPGYNPFAHVAEENRIDWYIFLLFLIAHEGALVDGGVAEHVEWILQKQFKTVAEWLGEEGDKLRRSWWGAKPMPEGFKESWRAFRTERASMTIADIDAEIVSFPKQTETAARSLGLQLVLMNARTDSDLEPAFATFSQQRVAAVLFGLRSTTASNRSERPVHPGACGERCLLRAGRSALCGSSPRVRGTLRGVIPVRPEVRFIPARAGNAGEMAPLGFGVMSAR